MSKVGDGRTRTGIGRCINLIPPFNFQAADAFLLVFSVLDSESFNRMDVLKKQLDREKFGASKDKREVTRIF